MYRTIADIPIEPIYTIKAVAIQTGIRAVTLRAWERRYELLTPYRGGNLYRLYSEQDVALLRWVKSRVDSGLPISVVVAELKGIQMGGELPEPIPPLAPTVGRVKTHPVSYYAELLYRSLISQDEITAGIAIQEAQAELSLTVICMEVITPCLVNIGEAWHRGEIRIATEHAASAFLRGKLLGLLEAYPVRRGAPFILTGCAPTEQHEIGSLMISVLLRAEGYRVEYLGQDVPIDDLVDYARDVHPAMIILSATLESSMREMARLQEKLWAIRSAPRFGYGGRVFVMRPNLREKVAGIYLGDSLTNAIDTIKDILGK